MRFAHPDILWLLWLVPLLWLVLFSARRGAERRWQSFVAADLQPMMAGNVHRARRVMRSIVRLLAVALLIVAAARPQWGASEVEVEQEGIDLVVALDVSRSMLAEDLQPSRLSRAKAEISDLIETLDGDRIGLVFFAGAAFPQCPLTVDYATARLFLAQADPTMIGSQGTDLAAALRTSLELFGEEGGRQRVVLVVTDGEDFSGELVAVLEQLREAQVSLYAVGLGTPEGAPIPDVDDSGRRVGFVKDRDGQVVISRLEEGGLLELVRGTEGVYARAGRGGIDLGRLRAELNALEGSAFRAQRVVSYRERYAWPLAVGLFLLLLEPLLVDRRRAAVGAVLLAGCLSFTSDAHAWDPLQKAGRAAEAAQRALAAGDTTGAVESMLRAQALAPEDQKIRAGLAETFYDTGQFEPAIRQLDPLTGGQADSQQRRTALYNAGNAAFQLQDFERALDLYTDALLSDEGEPSDDLLHNLELAQRLLEQQQQEQNQDQESSDDSEQQDGEQSDQEQDQQSDQEQQQEQQDQQEQEQQDGESQDEQQQDQPQPPPSEEQAAQDSLQVPPPPELDQMTPEEAMRLLQALDFDEEELRKSVQRRLRGDDEEDEHDW